MRVIRPAAYLPPPPCPGPLVWFTVPESPPRFEAGVVLECNTCRNVVTSGNFLDSAHARTEIIMSPR